MALEKEPRPVIHSIVPLFRDYISVAERMALVACKRREVADRMIYFRLIENLTNTKIKNKLSDEEYLSLTGQFRVRNSDHFCI